MEAERQRAEAERLRMEAEWLQMFEFRFAECQVRDTWQTHRDRLRAVALLFFAERRFQLSAKYLPSAQ